MTATRTTASQTATWLRDLAVAALEDVKARDIVCFDVTSLTSMTDWMIIASGESSRQLRALANRVQDRVRETGGHIVGVEGEEAGEWILVDLGDVVVHVMHPAVRQHYNLEELWHTGVARRHALGEAA